MERLDKPEGIVIHHSATRDTSSISFDAIARYHVGHNGWDAIGYHYLIEDVAFTPQIFTGRGIQYKGAHCPGLNNHIGVCVVGNYDVEELPPAKLTTLVNLLSGLLETFALMPSDITYHSQHSEKTCPGEKFPTVAALRSLLAVWRLN